MTKQAKFCAILCDAARRSGIGIQPIGGPGKYCYRFVDSFTGITGKIKETKDKALLSACIELQRYFTPWKKKK